MSEIEYRYINEEYMRRLLPKWVAAMTELLRIRNAALAECVRAVTSKEGSGDD